MLSEKGRTSKVHHKLELVMVLTEVIRPLLLPGDFEGEAGQERSTCYSHVYKSLPCVPQLKYRAPFFWPMTGLEGASPTISSIEML
jgi:hypothetical protein